jgi:hypothetical protein
MLEELNPKINPDVSIEVDLPREFGRSFPGAEGVLLL